MHLFQETENVYDGDYSCKVSFVTAPKCLICCRLHLTLQQEKNTLTVCGIFDNDPLISIKVYAEFYDADGGDIYGEDPVFGQDGDTSWQNISWTGTVPKALWLVMHGSNFMMMKALLIMEPFILTMCFEVGGQNLVAMAALNSGTVLEQLSNLLLSVKVYPNPFNDQLTT